MIPAYLFDELKQHIQLVGGILSGDDTVIDKPYSNPNLTELIGYFWSGKHHPCCERAAPDYHLLHGPIRQVSTRQLSHL